MYRRASLSQSIRSCSLCPCSLVMPAAKPQMDHYVPAEWEGQETSNGNWRGGRDTLIQLRSGDRNSKWAMLIL